VYSIALYFFHGDQATAADVTQQVFLKLMTSIRQFRGDAEFSTWLYRLVVNACMDVARRNRSHQLASAQSSRERETPAGSHEEYERRERAALVRSAVSDLPLKLRIAVLLRYFDDLSYQEMAKALDCSLGTVASRLSRGHRILADRLKNLSDEK